ncbi:uncharacterized protein METZ01_LOCUS352697 [marine metagenome]|uniref:Uncharacterized protein n=1 Tax=marine metagenome TaxID=408172 RepID=A0A382RQ75_9ZZZZ
MSSHDLVFNNSALFVRLTLIWLEKVNPGYINAFFNANPRNCNLTLIR